MKSILVVDDDESIRKYLRRILETHGYEVLDACDGNAAIERYVEREPDLVVLDILMPGKDGIETLFELKKNDKHIKIIIMSGGGRLRPDNYLEIAEMVGVCAAMKKPFAKEEFLAEVDHALLN